jgi:hypothetical protein
VGGVGNTSEKENDTMTIFDSGTMEEKKAILENEAKLRQGDRPPLTYSQIASWSTVEDLPKPSLAVPMLPPTSPWSGATGPGTEPPLGYAIDDVEPCGTAAEIAKSLRERK